MARSMWKGSIQFGLVNIPVKLYKAIEESKTKMHQYHECDGGQVTLKKFCTKCRNELVHNDIIKGIEVDGGNIVTIGADELKMIRPEKNSWIVISQFIPTHQIEPFYFNAHYYLGAEKKKDKTFFLFRNALRQCAKTAIGKFIMREKEYVCAIEAYRNGLLLTTLNYEDEIRNIDEIANIAEEPEISDEEMKFARQIIDQSSADELDMSKFSDTFKAEFENLVATKASGKTFTVEEIEPVKQADMNFIELLKASVIAT